MTVARTATSPTVEQRLLAVEQRINLLESERPGRKPKPLLVIRQRGVCAIDPNRDSATCPEASIYRYQSGCHGDACRLKQHEAYERRKINGEAAPAKAKKATPKKTRSATKAKAPAKPTVKKRITKRAAPV